jgi:hypothetical protein
MLVAHLRLLVELNYSSWIYRQKGIILYEQYCAKMAIVERT